MMMAKKIVFEIIADSDCTTPVSYTHLLSFVIEKITVDKTYSVAGKLPLSLNRSSPKTIDLENSIIQGCMQNII